MTPRWRGRTILLGMIPTKPVSLDVRLDWLILQTGIVKSSADRRLNAIENQLASLSRQWRGSDRVEVAREVRLSPLTFCELCAWLSKRGNPDACTAERLTVYSAARDDLVPDGWLRMLLTEQGQHFLPVG